MRPRKLYTTDFHAIDPGWMAPNPDDLKRTFGKEGLLLDGRGGSANLDGPGIHTRNGDAIELHFQTVGGAKGVLSFGFTGGMESAVATLDFAKHTVELRTSDWSSPQPVDA